MRLTDEGERLVQSWIDAKARVERLRAELNSANCAAENAETALVRWLMPPDVKVGERIAVWVGDSLLLAHCAAMGLGGPDGAVEVRFKGPKWGMR